MECAGGAVDFQCLCVVVRTGMPRVSPFVVFFLFRWFPEGPITAPLFTTPPPPCAPPNLSGNRVPALTRRGVPCSAPVVVVAGVRAGCSLVFTPLSAYRGLALGVLSCLSLGRLEFFLFSSGV